MKSRFRSHNRWGASGRITYPLGNPNPGPYPYQEQAWSCTDYIEKKKDVVSGLTPPSPLDMMKVQVSPPLLNVRMSALDNGQLYFNMVDVPCYPPTGLTPSTPPASWDSMEGTNETLLAKLLADTNPFRYEVSIPVMVSEFVEAASLLKLGMANMFSLTGSAYLNWVFGWKLLLGDVKTITALTTHVEARIREFNEIIETGGSRKRVWLASKSVRVDQGNTSIYSSGLGEWQGQVTSVFKTTVWGSVRWVPNRASPIEFSKLTEFNNAARIVLDLEHLDASTIWEAIPWSWLIDYFLNVGDTLKAIENTDKVLPTDICLMKHRVVTTTTIGIPKAEVQPPWRIANSVSPGKVVYDRKTRTTVGNIDGVEDLLSFGFMTKGQATNLLALLFSLQRFRNRY